MMIRFDGYYLEEPTQVHNRRSTDNKVSYSFNAYLFKEKGMLFISSKHDYIESLSDFTKEDFDHSKSIVKEYGINNNELNLKSSSPFGKDSILKVIGENKLYNSLSEKYLQFIPWNTIEPNKANAMINLYESLDKSRLKTHNE